MSSDFGVIPCFGVWARKRPPSLTLRIFWCLFQIKRVEDELFSQRQDKRRIRVYGWSIKLFGMAR